ncbi:MAG: hypothetical protein RR904_07515 [Bacilli bacterium]
MTKNTKLRLKNDLKNEKKSIELIKKNLKKMKFRTQQEIIDFLENNNIHISQGSVSTYLNENNIHKNEDGYYEDVNARSREYLVNELLLKSHAKIFEPKIYGVDLNQDNSVNNLYFIFIKLDLGYENFLYEVLSDYLPKEFSYLVGHGCIQIFINTKKNINVLYNKLNNIKEM